MAHGGQIEARSGETETVFALSAALMRASRGPTSFAADALNQRAFTSILCPVVAVIHESRVAAQM
jgi:hypothetical protein